MSNVTIEQVVMIIETIGVLKRDGLKGLIDDHKLDLIWRFIAVVFLEHEGLVQTRQQNLTIWVMRVDDRKGQDISGEA